MKRNIQHSQARFLSVLLQLSGLILSAVLFFGGSLEAGETSDATAADETSVTKESSSEFDWLFAPSKPKSALSYSLGVTYDYLSQTFFLLETDTNSLETVTRLNQEYLNQPALFINARFKPWRSDQLQLAGYAERSEEYTRARLESFFRTTNSASRVSGDFSLEGRARNSGELEFGDEYALARARLKYRGQVAQSSHAYITLRGEIHRLGDMPDNEFSVFTGDYDKGGAEAGLEFDIGQLDRLALSASFQRRSVRDREDLNYRLGRLRVDYSGYTAASLYALEFSFENRNYDSSGNDNDQKQFDLSANGEYQLSPVLTVVGSMRLETVNYLQDALSFNIDQTLVDSEVKLRRRWGLTAFGFGFGYSRLSQKDDISSSSAAILDVDGTTEGLSEEYIERAGITSFEYFKLSRIMLTIENQLGFRDIAVESEYQSDYWFDRISIFTSLNITGSLKFDLIGSFDFEWHNQDSDDNALYLLNTSFSYAVN